MSMGFSYSHFYKKNKTSGIVYLNIEVMLGK